ncbi:GH25 family lysozyme [Streptomyces sp. NPDC020883]|uniref:GH25 family lysozyme n=1 Tax=Streptomyces sp. NPDC020883 TaxID=3365099 RepID=UPI00379A36DC
MGGRPRLEHLEGHLSQAGAAVPPGHKTILYCNRDSWLNRDTTSFAAGGLWIAQYDNRPGRPDIQYPWLFHQYTDQPLDTSIGDFHGGAALRTWSRHIAVPA